VDKCVWQEVCAAAPRVGGVQPRLAGIAGEQDKLAVIGEAAIRPLATVLRVPGVVLVEIAVGIERVDTISGLTKRLSRL
jgi:hypothetical protein